MDINWSDYSNIYKKSLYDDVLPFWLKNGLDKKHGGFYTCLDRVGKIYNTDKPVWVQGRAAWMFSRLYNSVEKRDEWLNAAKTAVDFILSHCFVKGGDGGRMYFSVTQDGRPLQTRRDVFSETFAIIGLAEYSRACGDHTFLEKARVLFSWVMDAYRTPGKITPKIDPGTRTVKSLALPMILVATAQVLRENDTHNDYDAYISECLDDILHNFYKPEKKALFENVTPGGATLDSPQGRCINPGHSIETAWFIMHEGVNRNNGDLINKAVSILDFSLELGWDKEHGGLYYFVDIEGKPAEQLEWDMKLWWPHTEAIYCTLLAYYLTKNEKYAKWHKILHDYSFARFADDGYGEWIGYLHRDGTISNTLKGSLWKGPFHLPRALLFSIDILQKIMAT